MSEIFKIKNKYKIASNPGADYISIYIKYFVPSDSSTAYPLRIIFFFGIAPLSGELQLREII